MTVPSRGLRRTITYPTDGILRTWPVGALARAPVSTAGGDEDLLLAPAGGDEDLLVRSEHAETE